MMPSVRVSPQLPGLRHPTDGELVRRIVRRGLIARQPAALRSLDPGPDLDDLVEVHALRSGSTLIVSQDLRDQLRKVVHEVASRRLRYTTVDGSQGVVE